MRDLLTACALFCLVGCAEREEGIAAASPKGARAALVELARAEKGNLADSWTFLGNVRAGMHAEIAAASAGEVRWVGAREGDHMRKGASLLRVDARVARAKLLGARAMEKRAAETLAQAQREVARFSRLTREARSELELERARSAVRLAEAEISVLAAQRKEAAAQLALHRLDAPFSGVITRRLVDPGDWVSVGTRVLELVSSDELEVLVDVSPRLLQFVARETKATLLIAPGVRVAARIVGVVRTLDPVARTARVRLRPLPGKDGAAPPLRAGAAIRVAFAVERGGGVVVPRDALVVGPTATRVVKVVGGKAHPLEVDVLATAAKRALVMVKGDTEAKELKAGDQVVVRGNERVRPGQAVRTAAESKTSP